MFDALKIDKKWWKKENVVEVTHKEYTPVRDDGIRHNVNGHKNTDNDKTLVELECLTQKEQEIGAFSELFMNSVI